METLVVDSAKRAVSWWLVACMAAVLAMVVVGGLTRMTESGLSIVEWKPLSGTFPPMSHAAWEESFGAYQQSPQYLKINKGMSLEEYQGIFWLEYLHRLLGRVIGMVFVLPLAWFWLKKQLSLTFARRLFGIFLLGGLQGVVGWYMVKSGLVDEPRVSPYRLALHLGLAFSVFGLLLWAWLDVRTRQASLRWGAEALVSGLVLLQVLLGALVAGLDAGLTYNTYPLMDGRLVPEGLYLIEPWWRNHFENVGMVQFQHRMGAHLLVLVFAVYTWRLTRSPLCVKFPVLIKGVLAVFLLQFVLGVLTLVHVVPMALASLHQLVAALLFGGCIAMWHQSSAPAEMCGDKLARKMA